MMCEKCGAQMAPGSIKCDHCGAAPQINMDAKIVSEVEEIHDLPVVEEVVEVNHDDVVSEINDHQDNLDGIPEVVIDPSNTSIPEIIDINDTMDSGVAAATAWPTTEEEPEIIDISLDSEPVSEIEPAEEVLIPITEEVDEIVSIPEIVPVPSVEEVEIPVYEVEDGTWTDKDPEPEVEVISYDPNEEEEEEIPAPVSDLPKPDLLRGMNEPTPEELEQLKIKKEKERRRSELFGKINKIALLIVIVGIVIFASYFGFRWYSKQSQHVNEYQYKGYTFHIDSSYRAEEKDGKLLITDTAQLEKLSVQILEHSFQEMELSYLQDRDGFVKRMKFNFGNDFVKKVEQKNILGKSFIIVACISEKENTYIVYTSTSDDYVIQAVYSQKDGIINQSSFDKIAHNLLQVAKEKEN